MSAERILRWSVVVACALPAAALVVLASWIAVSERGTAVAQADCALVFGSAAYGYDVPGPAMLRRVSTAVRLYHEGAVQRLVLTGGKVDDDDQSEAEVMQRYAVRQSVPAAVMRTEERATSTWQNLAYAQPLLQDCTSLLGISDGYHLGRIRLFAFMQGWGSLDTYPADTPPPRMHHLQSFARELAAAVYYMVLVPFVGDPQATE